MGRTIVMWRGLRYEPPRPGNHIELDAKAVQVHVMINILGCMETGFSDGEPPKKNCFLASRRTFSSCFCNQLVFLLFL